MRWRSTERCVYDRDLFFALSVYYGDIIKKKEVGIVAGQVAVSCAGPGRGLSSKYLLLY